MPIITTLFERGAFSASDSQMTALALMAYATGLPAYILIKILTPAFHGRQDTKTPVILALIAFFVNISVNLALMSPLGHIGFALGTATASWVNAALLLIILMRRQHFFITPGTMRRIMGTLAASLVMGLGLYLAQSQIPPVLNPNFMERLMGLTMLIAGGALLFFVCAILFGAFRLRFLLDGLKRSA